jgi:uncharacterized membrane protein
MKITLKGFTEYALFALNIFIVFLLLLSDRIVVPSWLQSVGRLHPLLLHFPIVLLLLAMFLEVFRFNKAYVGVTLYQKFTSGLLLAGIFLTSVTVIMGLLLSKEDGYSGTILEWHKWTGTSLVFIASFIYWLRDKSWYNATLSRIAALITVVTLLITGHYGAALTHGDNFVLAPVTPPKEKVTVDQAVLFEDVILPILNTKCLSCHNMEKAKGGLNLATAEAVLKGGKNGKLFVPGNPAISLLLERVHLPFDDEKRMPPKGKPALTDEEMAISTLWIKGNAEMDKKVIDLPQQDSLRILATASLGPVATAEEKYNFSAASTETVQKLNNDYRIISVLDRGSPALAVNIYNKSIFKSEALKELDPIKKQIVFLNLNGLPVQDEDLKTIASFENLRKLNLNFTAIKGDGLKHLLPLKLLNALSLSGTAVNFNFVKQLLDMKNLRELSLWRTGLKATEIEQLQKMAKGMQIIAGFKDDGKSPIKLNQPRLNTSVSIFKNSLPLQIKHPINGVEIRYTTDGTEPDSLKSPLYAKGIEIKEGLTLKAKAYKSGWFGSDVMSFDFYQSRFKPDSIAFLIAPSDKYKGDGPKTLTDNQLGNNDIQSGKWIGYNDNMALLMFFKEQIPLKSISLHIMKKIPSHILPPQELEIWGGTDEKNLRLLQTIKNPMPAKDETDAFIKLDSKFASQPVSCIKITGKNFKKLPEWHPAKGQPAWIFLDEILLN